MSKTSKAKVLRCAHCGGEIEQGRTQVVDTKLFHLGCVAEYERFKRVTHYESIGLKFLGRNILAAISDDDVPEAGYPWVLVFTTSEEEAYLKGFNSEKEVVQSLEEWAESNDDWTPSVLYHDEKRVKFDIKYVVKIHA